MSSLRRPLVAVALTAAVAAGTVASAAALGGLSSANLGADVSVVAGCDPDGLVVSFDPLHVGGTWQISTVTVADLDPGCAGQLLDVSVAGEGAQLATGSVEAIGAEVVVPLDAGVPAGAVDAVSVAISG